MSKRPTFEDLILAYGDASADEALWRLDSATKPWSDAVNRTEAAYDNLCRALRKAGVPLDQVAP